MMNRKDMVKVADESVEGANIYKSKIGMLYIGTQCTEQRFNYDPYVGETPVYNNTLTTFQVLSLIHI